MSVEERDPYTGYLTTGHEWNGIKELNTKVPKLLLGCLALAFLFSVGYWYLLPAWPLGKSFTPGKLGLDQKDEIKEQLSQAMATQSEWSERMLDNSFDAIKNEPGLMSKVQESGPALYADNCAMCHGQKAEGNLYFPSLIDSAWLWGGTPEQIHKTLLVGINAGVEGTRVSQMPAFGTTAVLNSNEIDDVVNYVTSLASDQIGDGSRAEEVLSVTRGESVYKTNCAACHGANGQGNIALGAPNLGDNFWLYGWNKESLKKSITNGRAGWMPAWKGRLDDIELKMLSIYVSGLSSAEDVNTTNKDGAK